MPSIRELAASGREAVVVFDDLSRGTRRACWCGWSLRSFWPGAGPGTYPAALRPGEPRPAHQGRLRAEAGRGAGGAVSYLQPQSL
ncbi:hypothetical protein M5E87_10670 [Flavonifractor plautii]|nr:hypothetical protein M5E87_10670 [Flavonifractor plautii]